MNKHRIIGLLIVFFVLIQLSAASSWPMFKNNYNNDADSHDYIGLPLENQKLSNHDVTSPLIISDNVIYFGSYKHLYAIDSSDGTSKWKYTTEGTIAPSPSIYDNTVYFGSDNDFYAINAENGNLKWVYPTEGTITSSPAVYDNTAYFGSWDGYFYAININNGTLKWKYATKGDITSSPAIYDDTVYFGSWDNHLYAVNANNGDLIWKKRTLWSVSASPIIKDNAVLIKSDDGKLYSFDSKSGESLWSKWVSFPIIATDISYSENDGIYITKHNKILKINSSNGHKMWSEKLDGQLNSPVITKKYIFVSSDDGVVYAIDRINGTFHETYHIEDDNRYASLAVSNGILYVGSNDAVYKFIHNASKNIDLIDFIKLPNRKSINVGEHPIITVGVCNEAPRTVKPDIVLNIDEQFYDVKSIEIKPEDCDDVYFKVEKILDIGMHNISVLNVHEMLQVYGIEVNVPDNALVDDSFVISGSLNKPDNETVHISVTNNMGTLFEGSTLVEDAQFSIEVGTKNARESMYDVSVSNGELSDKKTIKLLKKSAEFKVESNVIPLNSIENETTMVYVDVKNIGNKDGTKTIQLIVNDKLEDSKDIFVPSGDIDHTNFSLKKPAGEYTISVDGNTHNINVRSIPILRIDEIGHDAKTQELLISGYSNLDANFIKTIVTNPDNIEIPDNKKINIGNFLIKESYDKPGVYTVKIYSKYSNVSDINSIQIPQKNSGIFVSSLSRSAYVVNVGEDEVISVTYMNNGDAYKTQRFSVGIINGESKPDEISLGPRKEVTKTYIFRNLDVGNYVVQAGGLKTQFNVQDTSIKNNMLPPPELYTDITSVKRYGTIQVELKARNTFNYPVDIYMEVQVDDGLIIRDSPLTGSNGKSYSTKKIYGALPDNTYRLQANVIANEQGSAYVYGYVEYIFKNRTRIQTPKATKEIQIRNTPSYD